MPGLCAVLLAGAWASPAHAEPADISKRILATPPLQWDAAMLSSRPAQRQSAADLANLTGGIVFGMSPVDVNERLAEPAAGLDWTNLPTATEYPEDVRYFWIRLDGARDLRVGVESCVGPASYIVFLFRARGLFRISYRFVPDPNCPALAATVTDMFARYVRLEREVALAVHYRTGPIEVIDVTDPTAGYLIPQRWRVRGR